MCRFWQSMAYLYHSKHITVPHVGLLGSLERSTCSMMHGVVRMSFTRDHIAQKFESWSLRGGSDPSSVYVSMVYPITLFPEWMLFPVRGMPFEGFSFFAPTDVEAYLESMYEADWRELPPLALRRNHAPVELGFGNSEREML